ncbi:MAG: hypothetical protein R6W90_15045 [Ignavibacteriaceae bacterium]
MKILTLFLLLSSIVLPQQQEARFFDAPFGGGGGYVPGWYMPDLKPINAELKSFGFPELSTGGFYTSGGAGFIYIGFVPGLRIGGMGFSGSTSESESAGGRLSEESIYSLGGGGLTVEYTLPFLRNIGFSLGAVIGGGSLKLEQYQTVDSYDWDAVWSLLDDSPGFNRTINNNFWFFTPTLNIDIPIYSRFVIFRVGAGYQLTFGDDWTIYNDKTLNNVPSDVSGNSFFIQSGIFIGFFSF